MKCNFSCINFIKISKLSVIIFFFLKAMGKHFMQVVSFPFPFSDICGMPVMHQALWQALLPTLFHLVLKEKKHKL